MTTAKRFLAYDIGASNGRAVVGEFDGEKLTCRDIYHFPNDPVHVPGGFHWDIFRLFHEVKQGLWAYRSEFGCELDGIGIDTWGVDFGLFDRNGRLLGNPHHYRDSRCDGAAEELRQVIDGYELFQQTGVAIQQVATITQMYAYAKNKSPLLEVAKSFLMIPSIFNYYLTGEKVDEHSNISNTALLAIKDNTPAKGVLSAIGISRNILPRFVMPGDTIGPLRGRVADELGMGSVPVFAPATHDSASAVLSIPADPTTNWAFLSCGTWSVLGVETDRPILGPRAYELNLTSAATADGKYMSRFNINGLWILQEIRRAWEGQGSRMNWRGMVRVVASTEPFTAFIDVDDPAFADPVDMPSAIIEYLTSTEQRIPDDKGTMVRIVLESLAMKYRYLLRQIKELSGKPIDVLHIVGGGVKNTVLCSLTASAVGIPVVAGPMEATCSGNLLTQMMGAGIVKTIDEGRMLLRSSYDLTLYKPHHAKAWDEAYQRYLKVTGRK